MHVKETRELLITYCDVCGKELPGNCYGLDTEPRMHFCNNYQEGVGHCLDIYNKLKQINKFLKTRSRELVIKFI